ncbi:hypothetical protein CIG75_15255 [Tumebacillus algifaecis]|uniref:Uncharacterized protein n=1 Tax=Tumebacillus algifaecis TaxID=1214604 RepID=A0A223D3K7_9BACL|nr:hypothetical protein [Tumebacillus algifaecis]ASS76161.1 hypothetical protein CIG75_15255 [Tumebacillus algifaecis]
MSERDGIQSHLMAEFEAETDESFTYKNRWGDGIVEEKRNASEQGLDEACGVAEDEGMQNQVAELGGQLQQGLNTGRQDEDGDGQPLAAKDGFRADYDDSSDV